MFKRAEKFKNKILNEIRDKLGVPDANYTELGLTHFADQYVIRVHYNEDVDIDIKIIITKLL